MEAPGFIHHDQRRPVPAREERRLQAVEHVEQQGLDERRILFHRPEREHLEGRIGERVGLVVEQVPVNPAPDPRRQALLERPRQRAVHQRAQAARLRGVEVEPVDGVGELATVRLRQRALAHQHRAEGVEEVALFRRGRRRERIDGDTARQAEVQIRAADRRRQVAVAMHQIEDDDPRRRGVQRAAHQMIQRACLPAVDRAEHQAVADAGDVEVKAARGPLLRRQRGDRRMAVPIGRRPRVNREQEAHIRDGRLVEFHPAIVPGGIARQHARPLVEDVVALRHQRPVVQRDERAGLGRHLTRGLAIRDERQGTFPGDVLVNLLRAVRRRNLFHDGGAVAQLAVVGEPGRDAAALRLNRNPRPLQTGGKGTGERIEGGEEPRRGGGRRLFQRQDLDLGLTDAQDAEIFGDLGITEGVVEMGGAAVPCDAGLGRVQEAPEKHEPLIGRQAAEVELVEVPNKGIRHLAELRVIARDLPRLQGDGRPRGDGRPPRIGDGRALIEQPHHDVDGVELAPVHDRPRAFQEVLIDPKVVVEQLHRGLKAVAVGEPRRRVQTLGIAAAHGKHLEEMPGLGEKRLVVDHPPDRNERVEGAGLPIVARASFKQAHGRRPRCARRSGVLERVVAGAYELRPPQDVEHLGILPGGLARAEDHHDHDRGKDQRFQEDDREHRRDHRQEHEAAIDPDPRHADAQRLVERFKDRAHDRLAHRNIAMSSRAPSAPAQANASFTISPNICPPCGSQIQVINTPTTAITAR